MAILQYRCPKHPKLTRRSTHPTGMQDTEYSENNFNKGKIQYEHIIPKCPTCREPMEPLWSRDKGNKYRDGVCTEIDESFKKRLTWCIKKGKKK